MTADNLKAWQARLGFSELAFAAYLGVPVGTLRKWQNGQRTPDSAPLRLFAVLELVEKHAPDLHTAIVGAARDTAPVSSGAQDRPHGARKGRGRVKGAPVAPSAPAARESAAAPVPWVHAAAALPGWMVGGA